MWQHDEGVVVCEAVKGNIMYLMLQRQARPCLLL
jgi:hypothetical protein